MTKRVLYVHASSKIAGGNRVLLGLLASSESLEIQPYSLLPERGPLEAELKALGVPYSIIPFFSWGLSGKRWLEALVFIRLVFLYLRFRPNIIHAVGPVAYRIATLPFRFFPLKALGAARLCHIHLRPAELEWKWVFDLEPDLIVTCSEGLVKYYQSSAQIPAEEVPVVAIPNFADTELYQPGVSSFVPPNGGSLVISVIGRLSKRKGQREFLQSVANLLLATPEAQLLFIGEEEDLEISELEKLAETLGVKNQAHFLGSRSDVPDILKRSQVVVLPSATEGLPLTLIEASATAVPVVAFNIEGVNEVVEHEQTGLLVPVGDFGALVESVQKLLLSEPLRNTLGKNGRARVIERYLFERFRRDFQAVYGKF